MPATPARERLLDAGIELFAELPPASLFGGVSVSALARRARTTRATFYHHWPTLDAYFVDMARYAFRVQDTWQVDPTRRLPLFLDPDRSRIDSLRDASGHELALVAGDSTFAMRLSLTAHSNEPAISPLLRSYHRDRDQTAIETTSLLWSLWNRVPREPFTYESVAALWTAMLDGLAMRQRLDPDFDGMGLFGDAAVALLPAISRDRDDPAELDRWAGAIERFPTMSAHARPKAVVDTPPKPRGEVAAAVLAAAFELLEDQAWSEITSRALAKQAGVDESALFDAFGSKAGVAALTLSQLTHRRIAELQPEPDPVDHLRQLLQCLRSVIRTHRALARATLMAVTENAPGAPPDTVADLPFSHHIIADGIRAAQETGTIRPDVPALPLALHWGRSILLEQVAHGVDGNKGFDLVDIMIDGVRVGASDQRS